MYRETFPLFRYIMLVISVLYICFSFSRPDAFVVRYNVAHTEQLSVEDVQYFLYETSMDATPEIAKLDISKIYDRNEYGQGYLEEQMYNYFQNISVENKGIFFRKANYSRIKAKLAADKYVENNRRNKFDILY